MSQTQGENQIKKLMIFTILFGIYVVLSSVVIIFTPHLFVRTVNILGLVVASIIIGAFVRELFLLKHKDIKQ
ncbi:hypothetical protein [Sutcliffiella rhizosphaerae]|uniref:Uncharacterized protein n=1 Tax=Sutcliffiella rhizosphaerae TaxID=2880967 RepID=A0ABN8AB64_9BACI|nr:hypothetical protein [Sutcliffiella rhizosphaerae]CAG9621287.1 hypothetical protein BACCIP111883_02059 [Sutcliffiella rhizosphaerae]